MGGSGEGPPIRVSHASLKRSHGGTQTQREEGSSPCSPCLRVTPPTPFASWPRMPPVAPRLQLCREDRDTAPVLYSSFPAVCSCDSPPVENWKISGGGIHFKATCVYMTGTWIRTRSLHKPSAKNILSRASRWFVVFTPPPPRFTMPTCTRRISTA